ncbi:primosomal protein DnaI [Saliterribacillus persicus]|uniref:Replicative DNA helicase loader DnaI n=1 Tax=Saliterribacillus persicus TaxID=930114 RepID=A0A368XEE2_9BACI|nr:primosomal protein DnaI [Saliterribacillus persicus]RCW66332.1 replicative DNA helicase loader DnaI [Saliterribacillus persicus]
MEPIQKAMKNWMRNNESFQSNYQEIRKKIINDPQIQSVLSKHIELDESDINRNLMKLYEFQSASKNCNDCANLESCKNILKGYTPNLVVEGKDVTLRYEKCHKHIQYEEMRKRESLIQSLYMPKQISNARLKDLETGEYDRKGAVQAIIELLDASDKAPIKKGLYFHGPFGTGKTFMLGVIANELANRNIQCTVIYMPEFVREMKASIRDDSLNDKIEHFKRADVLMFDDIGAESISSWFRDEILGSILQYRMMEEQPVFFTSNYNLDQLEKHLATTNRGDTEAIKAARIIERIKQLSKPVSLFDRYRTDD